MVQAKDTITNTFQEIQQTELWDARLPISFDDYAALLSATDTEMLFAMVEQADEVAISKIKFSELMKMPFERAQRVIGAFSLAKRINVLAELGKHRDFLYNQAARYEIVNPKDPGYLPVRDWQIIMGKIKHLEILQTWLYGI